MHFLTKILATFVLMVVTIPADAFVISEIHYNPFGSNEALEYIEITNNTSTPEDLSGYSIVEGVFFEFPAGTILDADAVLVICANVDAVMAVYAIDNAIGNFSGVLDNNGERISIANHVGVVVQSLLYRDEGKWSVGPDGTGHSLVLSGLYLDPTEPESWEQSLEIGGSPGLFNLGGEIKPEIEVTVHLDEGHVWSYFKGLAPFSDPPDAWREPDFDDSSWPVGPSGFGFGDSNENTLLDDMLNNYSSVVIRTVFTLTQEQLDGDGEFLLGVNYDDGFCAYLNGDLMGVSNCPAPVTFDQFAAAPREAREEQQFRFDKSLLVPGDNVVAIAGYNRDGSRDFTLIPRVLHHRITDDGLPPAASVRFNELFRDDGNGNGWVELHNDRGVAEDLSGALITDDPNRPNPYVLPPDTMIEADGFLVVDEVDLPFGVSGEEVRLFLIGSDRIVLAATVFEFRPPPDLVLTGLSEGRFPDGGRKGWITETPTRGLPNVVARNEDVVINEIFYHPPENREGEFIELYHRGTEPVDLSGFQFDSGVTFSIPDGTVLEPGEFLVVAKRPDLLEIDHGYFDALGPYAGQLANGGESVRLSDVLGNLVDEVRYFDGGQWSRWADGGGASLELIDPTADNDYGPAWGASDESDKAEWEDFSYVVPEYDVSSSSEFHLFLPERGVCRVDDVSMRERTFSKNALVDAGDVWKYRRGTEAFSEPALAWVAPDFDDSQWETGPSGFGFGVLDAVTVLGDMNGNYTSVAVRKGFDLSAALINSSATVALGVDYEGGFCAFLNGVEVGRRNCPDSVTHDALATTARTVGFETIVELPADLLEEQGNVVAIVGYVTFSNTQRYALVPRILDVSLATPGAERVTNGGFESSILGWLIEGTHGESDRIDSDTLSGSACLEIVATSKGDSLCNRVERDLPSGLRRRSYEVSLRARWQRGGSLIVTHGQFSPGAWFTTRDVNMSSNSLASRLRMTVPRDLGTPGAENSLRARLRSETGTENLGPVVTSLRHRPFVPLTGLPVRVEAAVRDPDGVVSVRAFYKRDVLTVFASVELFDDGNHADGAANDDVYGGDLPGFNQSDRVQFYVEGTDALGGVGRFPTEAPTKTGIYLVGDGSTEDLRIVMTSQDETELNTRATHSNALLDATVSFKDKEVFYNVGVRYRGSPWGRPQHNGFRVRFNKDQKFHGDRVSINLTNHDRNDGPAYYLIGRLGTHDKPSPVADYRYITARFNDRPLGVPGYYEPVGGDFLERWYGSGATDDMVCLKGTGRHRMSDGCDLAGWDEASLFHRRENQENYRHYYRHTIHQSRDDWSGMMSLTRVLDRNYTSAEEFESELHTVLDVEGFFRVLAPRIMLVDWDALYIGNGHNGYLVQDPRDGLWELLPFDFGAAFSSSSPDLLEVRDPQVARLLSHPPTLRLYYRLIDEFVETGYWSVEKIQPFMNALSASIARIGSTGFVGSSSGHIRRELEPFTDVPFRILTNGGADFSVDGTDATLEGEASVRVASLLVRVNGGDPFEPVVRWRDENRPIIWALTVSFGEATGIAIEVLGVDASGDVIETLSIGVSQGSGASFVRGDVGMDGALGLGDVMAILFHLFRGDALTCADAADFDDGGVLNISDAVALLVHLYGAGPPPAQPYPATGADLTADSLPNCNQP